MVSEEHTLCELWLAACGRFLQRGAHCTVQCPVFPSYELPWGSCLSTGLVHHHLHPYQRPQALPVGALSNLRHMATLLLLGPPSAPRDLVYSLRRSSLVLRWSAPADAGGRNDLTYSLWCSRCPAPRGGCEQCGNGVGFVPQQTGLVERTVTLVNLLPHANYTIRVVALNGVSAGSPLAGQPYAEVNVSTGLTGMGRVGV